jgi:hypothetical protein
LGVIRVARQVGQQAGVDLAGVNAKPARQAGR